MSVILKNTPVYDDDYANKAYVDKALSKVDEVVKEATDAVTKNYGSQPTPPYRVNDTWTDGTNIWVCITERLIGNFTQSDWRLAADYTNNSVFNPVKDMVLDSQNLSIPEQSDGKIESFYMTTDPATDWTDLLTKSVHNGDLWRNGDLIYVYRKQDTNPVTYKWERIYVITSFFDTIDGHKNIFIEKPSAYDVNDFWFVDDITDLTNVALGDLMYANTANTSFVASDWTKNDVDVIKMTALEDVYYNKTEVQDIKYDLTSSFSTAIEQTNMSITNTVEQLNTFKDTVNENYTTNTELNNVITQTVNETVNKISETGGFNLLQNTQFYQNADKWSKSVYSETSETADFVVNPITTSACKSELDLKNGYIYQSYDTIIGQTYTIAFKYKKVGTNSRYSAVALKVGTESTPILVESTEIAEYTDYKYTYVATTTNPTIIIYTLWDDFYITDLIVQPGTSIQWTPNALETIGLGHKLDKNSLELYDISGSGDISVQTPTSLTFKDNDIITSHYSQNNMMVPNGTISNVAHIAGLEFTKISDTVTLMN